MIYLDNAATTNPKPSCVRRAVADAMAGLCANPGRSGHRLSQEAALSVYRAREKAAAFFGEPNPENVIFTLNCTHAINYVLKGLLRPGDRVVTSSLEHNAVMRPLVQLAKNGVFFDVAEVAVGDPDATVRAFERAIGRDTKLVICTHASNVCGARLPIERIGRLCRDRGVRFAVDAAQSAGVLPIRVREMNVDYLCVAAHKGLYAPMGTGLLIAPGGELEPLVAGGTGTASVSMDQPDAPPERYESGTLNVPGIAGLGAGLDFVSARGTQRIYAHKMELIRALYDGLSRLRHARLYTERPDDRFAPVLSFNLGRASSVETANELGKAGFAVRAGLHCAPAAHKRLGTIEQGAVRVCPSVFTRREDIERLLFTLRRLDGAHRDLFY